MLIYKSENISVIIPQKCLKVLFELCEKANNLETGGIIYGNYSENLEDAIVYEFDKPPKDSKRGKTYFERGTFKVKEKIKKLWDKNIYYLGEWHYHPFSSPIPSYQDIIQMKKISKNKNFNCPEPILIIVGKVKEKFILSVHLFIENKKIELILE